MESSPTIEDELNRFLELTETDRTNDYLIILKETNAFVKKLMNDVSELSQQVKEERTLRNAAEDKLLQYRETANSNISRYLFNSFIKVSKERECTQLEWVKFTQDFRFSEDTKLIKEIYTWIDAHIK